MDNGQEYYPRAIYEALANVKENFIGDLPVFITENGTFSLTEQVVTGEDGKPVVHDPTRIRYFEGFLGWLKKAVDEGANVKGYFAWTMLDNFEWSAGYNYRFGLMRKEGDEYIRKDSAAWFERFLKG